MESYFINISSFLRFTLDTSSIHLSPQEGRLSLSAESFTSDMQKPIESLTESRIELIPRMDRHVKNLGMRINSYNIEEPLIF